MCCVCVCVCVVRLCLCCFSAYVAALRFRPGLAQLLATWGSAARGVPRALLQLRLQLAGLPLSSDIRAHNPCTKKICNFQLYYVVV